MNRTLIICAALLATAACSTSKPPLAIDQSPIVATHSVSEVESAILASLDGRGWKVVEKAPGKITAHIDVRAKHTATIAVTYSATSFSVNYVDSAGLDYDAKTGTIHRNYNRWVANLRNDINLRLS
jgi:hypothetical protein